MLNYKELDENALITKIAWYYYEHNLTQKEIGEKLNISRTKVVNLLSEAKNKGIVKFEIKSKYSPCFRLEEKLKEKFPFLKNIIIVPSTNDYRSTRNSVGKACALYLKEILKEKDLFGVAWGRTLYDVAKNIDFDIDFEIKVIQLMGGLNVDGQVNPQEIVKTITTALNASGIWLNTPAIVTQPETKKALLSDDNIRSVLKKAQYCQKALLGIGEVTDNASLLLSNALSEEEMQFLKSKDAVGDICGWYFDINGKLIDTEINNRIISFPLNKLHDIPLRIGVASGEEKVDPFIGGLRGKHINAIVTDDKTAKKIYEKV